MAHKTIGTFPGGTVRVSPGYFTSDEDIDIFLEAVRKIAQQ
jgi:selenocysteine lyase/cysteine desulfurase